MSCLGNDVSKKEIGRTFKDLQQLKKDELHRQGAAADALASSCNQTVQHPAEFVVSVRGVRVCMRAQGGAVRAGVERVCGHGRWFWGAATGAKDGAQTGCQSGLHVAAQRPCFG